MDPQTRRMQRSNPVSIPLVLLILLLSISLVAFACADDEEDMEDTGTTEAMETTETTEGMEDSDTDDSEMGDPTAEMAAYEITLENLTSGQPFSPPLFVTHGMNYMLYEVGEMADEELRVLAEDGNNEPVASDAESAEHVYSVEALSEPLAPGEMVTVTIEAPADQLFSLATMLVRTNDAFVGLNGVALPDEGEVIEELMVYDAGTEANNEMASHIPGPPFGGMEREPTEEAISEHEGIEGMGDLSTDEHGWDEPAARVTIIKSEM